MKNISTQSIVVIILTLGAFVLAVLDKGFREHFANIAQIGISGYIGYLVPKN